MRLNQFGTMRTAALVTGLAMVAVAGPAAAACFESGVNCTNDHNIPKSILRTLSCDSLWTVRNMIYDENGYCFKTPKALAVFSNDDCAYMNAANVPLNSFERTNIARIVAVEKENYCPK